MESTIQETFTPTLLWAQTYQDVEIEISLPNISNEVLTFENHNFHFECFSSNKKYLIDFELYGEIMNHNVSKSDKKITVYLEKKEEEKWDFLTKKRGIYKNNIKINWDKWADSDCDDEEEVKNIDMGGMKGMGGMGGMGDMMGGIGGMGEMGGMGGMGGMDMKMLQEMMANMGQNGGGEEGGEEGSEEGGEEGGEECGEEC